MMNEREQLHQQLLELIYDLLPEDEARRLRQRITSDPETARAYAETRQEADLLAEAARLEGRPVPLEKPSKQGKVAPADPVRTAPSPLVQRPFAVRAASHLAGLAAAVLVCVTLYSYLRPGSPLRQSTAESARRKIARDHVRLLVTGPSRLQAGVTNYYSVAATSLDGAPLPAEVDFSVYSPQGELLLKSDKPVATDKDGRLAIPLPADRRFNGARLEIAARRGESAARMDTRLAVEEVRYATYLSLDKPLYRPGETIRFRSLTLSHAGLAARRELPVAFKILDPGGGTVPGSEQQGYTDHGVAGGELAIPPHLAGGKYTLVAASPDEKEAFPEARRDFFIRRYRTPRLKKTLELARDSYAPGDEVEADFSADRAEGSPAAGAALRVIATVDGENVYTGRLKAGPAGACQIKFTLPEAIEKGDATLFVVVDDGGTRETIAETIPINLGKVAVDFFPEGGDLVAGLVNRVYFFACDPLGEPVHVEGRVIDDAGNEVAKVETVHEGRGAFRFTPEPNRKYALEITSPAGVATRPALPRAASGRKIVMDAGPGVFGPGEPIVLDVLSAESNVSLVVSAVCRGVQVGQQALVTPPASGGSPKNKGRTKVTLPLAPQVAGVVRLTVYDYSAGPPRPVAERLVFRRPAQKLNVAVADHPEAYTPGDAVELSLVVTDEDGRPVPAALGVSVVDDALLSLADDKSPRMTTHFFLTDQIEKPEDLEDANFYLSDEEDAARSLDLLLGTQGWRRFADASLAELVAAGQTPDNADNADKADEADKLGDADQPAADRREALGRLVALEGKTEMPTLYDNLSQVQDEFDAALAGYDAERQIDLHWAGGLSFFAGLALVVVLALMALVRLGSGVKFYLPTVAAAGACLVVGATWMVTVVDRRGELALAPFVLFDESRSMLAMNDAERASEESELKKESGLDLLGEEERDDLRRDGEENEEQLAAGDAKRLLGRGDDFTEEDEGRGEGLDRLEKADGKLGFDDEIAGREKQKRQLEELDADADIAVGDKRFAGGAGFGGGGFFGDLEAGGFFYAPDGKYNNGKNAGRFRRTGTIQDVARLRGLWKTAVARDDEQLALKLGAAYEKALKQYRLPVRQYAHRRRAGEPGVRSDFAETLYWHPLLLADAAGRATIDFDLPDSVTTFRVRADAHGAGRLGIGDGLIVSRIPFSLEPKLPLEVNAGDRIDLPLAVNNDTDGELPVVVSFEQPGAGNEQDALLELSGEARRELKLAPGERHREYFTLGVVGQAGQAELKISGRAGKFGDAIKKSIKVVPPGFPVAESYAGKIDGPEKVTVTLPEDWVPGSLEVSLGAFPSSLADLQKGLDGILREPYGCFEQTSSSNYPNVMALQYIEENDVDAPATADRARGLLKKGYSRLVGFECPEKGYEWFGGDPGHEALTAYGLMEFCDMRGVWDVDAEMVQRTARWLMDRRDGKGGFRRNPRALDSFGGAPQEITDAYIVWALTEAGQKGIEKELARVIGLARESDDPYLIALAAAAALSSGDAAAGKELLDKLAEHQADDGHLEGKNGSITRSGGLSLSVETTALAALAWLKTPAGAAPANKAIEWLTANRQGSGGFGSTQATVLALKALTEHAKANRRTVAAGALVVRRDGREIGRHEFGAGQTEAIEIDGVAAELTAGVNELTVELTGDNQMPYALDVSYRTLKPVSHPDCPVRLSTKLSTDRVKAGDAVGLDVALSNVSGEGQPMTIAVVGLPAGLEARTEQLEELKKAGKFDYYETAARELVFYWRSLGPDVKDDGRIALHLDLVAEIPGRYTGPASRAYLYYTAEQKHWADPLRIEITRD